MPFDENGKYFYDGGPTVSGYLWRVTSPDGKEYWLYTSGQEPEIAHYKAMAAVLKDIDSQTEQDIITRLEAVRVQCPFTLPEGYAAEYWGN